MAASFLDSQGELRPITDMRYLAVVTHSYQGAASFGVFRSWDEAHDAALAVADEMCGTDRSNAWVVALDPSTLEV